MFFNRKKPAMKDSYESPPPAVTQVDEVLLPVAKSRRHNALPARAAGSAKTKTAVI